MRGRNHLVRRDGQEIERGGSGEIQQDQGDVFVIVTPGGGGYGHLDDVATASGISESNA